MSKIKDHHHDLIEKGMRKLPQKEKPILFSAPMVQAILAGRKTQTRRILKSGFEHAEMQFSRVQYFKNPNVQTQAFFKDGDSLLGTKCPYGNVGDLLWVRETHAAEGVNDNHKVAPCYKASGHVAHKWTPSIHMKKDYSRIWLQITEIGVERLQVISEEDCKAEGIQEYGPFGEYAGSEHPAGGAMKYRAYGKASRAFECLWESINGEKSWRTNPWIWVVKFKVLSTTGKPQ